ncbi:MAG: YdeI/OmpD-associated family protein [Nanoarchaeota archaeon]
METFLAKDLNDWRNWLKKNHLKKDRIILVKYKKHTGKPLIPIGDLMKEAICFGWIDTTAKRIDEDKYGITYVKRNKNSKWSKNTLSYGRELLEKGLMSSFGIKMYKEGLAKKPHDYGIPKNPRVPKYLREELEKEPTANDNFKKIAPSYRRTLLRWLLKGKQEETKKKRVRSIVKSLKKNEKLFPAA